MATKLDLVGAEVEHAYLNGNTLAQIAEVHDCSTGTVRNLLRSRGVALRRKGRRAAGRPAPGAKDVLPLDTLSEALASSSEASAQEGV